MADYFLRWWTSQEVDERKAMIRNACDDRERLLALIRVAFDAGRAAPPVVPVEHKPLTTKRVDRQKSEDVDDKPDAYCEANCTRRYHDADCRHHP